MKKFCCQRKFEKCFRWKRSYSNYISTGETSTLLYLREKAQNKDIFIVGTVHVSEKSAEEVRQVRIEEGSETKKS